MAATRFRHPSAVKNHGPPAGLGWTLIVFGLFFMSVVVFKDAPLALFGQLTEGEIVKITERSTMGSKSPRRAGETLSAYRKRSKEGGVSYLLGVRFTPAGGQPVEIETKATYGFSEQVGDKVQMIYLPSRLQGAEIYSLKQLWLPLATGVVVSTLCLLGGGLILRLRRKYRLAQSTGAQ